MNCEKSNLMGLLHNFNNGLKSEFSSFLHPVCPSELTASETVLKEFWVFQFTVWNFFTEKIVFSLNFFVSLNLASSIFHPSILFCNIIWKSYLLHFQSKLLTMSWQQISSIVFSFQVSNWLFLNVKDICLISHRQVTS